MIERNKRLFQQENGTAGEHTEGEKEDLHGFCILFHFLFLPCADGLSRDDADGTRHAVHDDVGQVVQGVGHADGGNDALAGEMSHDDRVCHHVGCPDELSEHNRRAVVNEVTGEFTRREQEMLRTEGEFFVENKD